MAVGLSLEFNVWAAAELKQPGWDWSGLEFGYLIAASALLVTAAAALIRRR
jgi:hypothetical protein